MTMLASKYDGRIIGRFVDYAFFVGLVVKIPYIRAGWTAYDLTFWNEIVKTDTLLMTSIIKENKVRSRLQGKFIEYAIPVNSVNNSTYYSAGLVLALLAMGVLAFLKSRVSKKKRAVLVAEIFAATILAVSLPSTFFYSGVSSMLYARDDQLGRLRLFTHYMMGFLTFSISMTVLFGFNFFGCLRNKIFKFFRRGFQQTQRDEGNGGLNTREWSIWEKVFMEGINPKKTQAENAQNDNNNEDRDSNIKTFTANNMSILRYTLILFLIIPFQKLPKVMLVLQIIVQLFVLFVAIIYFVMEEFESIVVGVLFLVYEVALTALMGSLGLTLAIERDSNSTTRDYKLWTVPLITLLMLMIVTKLLQIVISVWNELKRVTQIQEQEMRERTEEVIMKEVYE